MSSQDLQAKTALADEIKMEKIQAYGRGVGAEYAFFLNGAFHQFYKKGGMSVRKCWLYMPFIKDRRHEWVNSHHFSLDQMMTFYKNIGKNAELVPIDPDGPIAE